MVWLLTHLQSTFPCILTYLVIIFFSANAQVNKETASVSEMLTSALRDNKRAVLLEPSSGRVSISLLLHAYSYASNSQLESFIFLSSLQQNSVSSSALWWLRLRCYSCWLWDTCSYHIDKVYCWFCSISFHLIS